MKPTSSRSGQPVDLLLVEDNPGDVRLIEEVFTDARLLNELHVTTDGDEAIDFLRQRGEYEDVPRPDLVLLDWNLPRAGGEEVLTAIRNDDTLQTVPVVVLTGSEAHRDMARSYELEANAYVTKPVDSEDLIELIRSLRKFWLEIVRLPPDDS